MAVVEGDQHTSNDAHRIRAAGARAIQINTGAGCHLEAVDVHHAVQHLDPEAGSLLLVENVGNLVCPALFDIGEAAKVVVLSTPEGDDKPEKYPHIFAGAALMIVNKTDLLPYVDFDVDRCVELARRVNPAIEAIALSARTGEGMAPWLDWLRARLAG